MSGKVSVVLCVIAVVVCAGSLHAGDASVALDLNQGYVWRGITFNDGLVFQPSLDVRTAGGLGLNVWGNMDIDDYDGAYEEGEFSEVDITLSYAREVGAVTLGGGYLEYLYPHQTGGTNALAGTREVYLSLSSGLIGDLSSTVCVYYDIDEIEDYYASLSLDYEIDPEGPLGMGVGAQIGYAGEDMSAGEDGGLHEYVIYGSVSYEICETVGISANIGYVDSLDDDVLSEQDVDVYGGLSLSIGL